MPDVSVLLPYRNAAATLDEAVESILSQRAVELELIAVDDGSEDDGARRIARRARVDRRLVPLRSPGRGICCALNAGLERARAPLCARMDADDVSLAGRLAAQRAALDAAPAVAALGCRVEAFPTGALAEGMRRYLGWQNSLIGVDDHARQIFVESPLCHPSVMLLRDAVRAVGGYREGPFPEDYDLWLRLHAAGYGLAKLPRTLLRWRHHPARATLRDPRYARPRFTELKAPHLARALRASGRAVCIWGAGKTGKRLARALEPHAVRAACFVDVDPAKIGGLARGAPVVGPEALGSAPDRDTVVVVAVGARGARDRVRQHLRARNFHEGTDFICAS